MNKTLKEKLIFIFRRLFARRIFQSLWMPLHKLSMIGLNVSGGAEIASSGERWVLRYIRAQLNNPHACIFDVGANKGDFSREVLSTFGPKIQLHAFEPSKITFEALSSDPLLQRHSSLHNFGLSDLDQETELFFPDTNTGHASVYPSESTANTHNFVRVERAVFRSLDSFCRQSHIKEIHFLKLDVEGHELHVLQGATEMLRQGAIQFIQFEFGEPNINSRTFFKDFFHLLSDQYSIYRILVDGLSSIPKYNLIYESFYCTNYLAKRND
ncbi:MAG TPA: FkbM family methyltransferase [Candidatus Kapabacteria bacterium]|nr:FkbM family methyltransferase [Candidatus Kapabacteria bacterium]